MSTAPNKYQIVNNYYSDKSDHTLHRLCPLFSLFLSFTECGDLFALGAGLSPCSIALWLGVVHQPGSLPPTIDLRWLWVVEMVQLVVHGPHAGSPQVICSERGTI